MGETVGWDGKKSKPLNFKKTDEPGCEDERYYWEWRKRGSLEVKLKSLKSELQRTILFGEDTRYLGYEETLCINIDVYDFPFLDWVDIRSVWVTTH